MSEFASSKPLKIIEVFNRYLLPGGEEEAVARMGSDLKDAGHAVTHFWRSSSEWNGPGAPAKFKQPFLLWRNGPVLAALRQLHENVKPDVWLVHNVVPVVSLGVYRLAKDLGVPIIQWLHNYRPISPSGTLCAGQTLLQPTDPLIYWKESWSGSWNGRLLTAWLALAYARVKQRGDFSSVHAWVAVSEEMKRIFQLAGWNPDKLYALPHSWSIHAESIGEEDRGHFLFLGRMVETKGVRFLVELWRDPALRNIPLVMAGQGPLMEDLRGASPANVRWVGHVEGEVKQQLIAGCRAILFPSVWPEPLGLVVYEAFERGKPVLASNLGGLKGLIRDGETGRLLEPNDHSGWLEAVRRLDATEARRLGNNGRKWLVENVSPAVWNRKFDVIAQRALRQAAKRSWAKE